MRIDFVAPAENFRSSAFRYCSLRRRTFPKTGPCTLAHFAGDSPDSTTSLLSVRKSWDSPSLQVYLFLPDAPQAAANLSAVFQEDYGRNIPDPFLPIFTAKVTAKDMASMVARCFNQKMMIVVKGGP
jgi:hypothetical protein